MTQALFRIGGVYRNGRGRVVKVADCYDFRTNAMRPGSIAVDSPDDMPQTFHPDLSTGRCELGNPNYSLIPGELHNFNGQWLPVEEKAEQPRAPYFAEAVEQPGAIDPDGFYKAHAAILARIEQEDRDWKDAAMIARDGPQITRPAPPPVAQEATSHAPLAGLTVLMERDHRFGLFRF